jgi:hypothetical protein
MQPARAQQSFGSDEVIGVSRVGDYRGCSRQDVRTWSMSNRHKHREGAAMKYFAGLDVALEETTICVVDQDGQIVKEARADSEFGRTIGL